MPFPPAAGHNPNWRFLSQKQHPERWLPYMVSINSALERAGSKLLSPLPQRTSFVPSHIRLDTAGEGRRARIAAYTDAGHACLTLLAASGASAASS